MSDDTPPAAAAADMAEKGEKLSRRRRMWRFFTRPSTRWAAGTLTAFGIVLGVLFWGGFNWAMELTNTESFCISCHEMESNVYREYRGTIHYSNRSGVRATCSDCHVPREWAYKVVRKVKATRELFYHLTGEINTAEKFENKRMQLAKNVWYEMKTTDSRECRNCHNFTFMDLAVQEPRAAERHTEAAKEGKTCIDCHRGIAHRLPEGALQVDLEQLVREREGGASVVQRE